MLPRGWDRRSFILFPTPTRALFRYTTAILTRGGAWSVVLCPFPRNIEVLNRIVRHLKEIYAHSTLFEVSFFRGERSLFSQKMETSVSSRFYLSPLKQPNRKPRSRGPGSRAQPPKLASRFLTRYRERPHSSVQGPAAYLGLREEP